MAASVGLDDLQERRRAYPWGVELKSDLAAVVDSITPNAVAYDRARSFCAQLDSDPWYMEKLDAFDAAGIVGP